MLALSWNKCTGNLWCELLNLNLNHPHFDNLEGVYIIWHGAPNAAVVYVGQGAIRDRLSQHRHEPKILAYSPNTLFVTWAQVNEVSRDGVECYLATIWKPKVGDKHPNAIPIQVNSPWQ